MTNVIIIAIVAVILVIAVAYIIREKKRGKCIGCPVEGGCSGHCGSCSGHCSGTP